MVSVRSRTASAKDVPWVLCQELSLALIVEGLDSLSCAPIDYTVSTMLDALIQYEGFHVQVNLMVDFKGITGARYREVMRVKGQLSGT
ncbi:hypothetical protein PAXRUDRAFT_361131 [Paxillus rubicundulus Ve08.2h10]|uniref:Uncharacterized protein n=1 Tax=Paxillus rubicundulus Ve08.2h10 TaxID=930991 RepID=A0A0D0EA86_9AGAM|nr:hypothetical protein PAXRUDRAFT_361131 [Paxillus rubicundulus Ve08.2h10]